MGAMFGAHLLKLEIVTDETPVTYSPKRIKTGRQVGGRIETRALMIARCVEAHHRIVTTNALLRLLTTEQTTVEIIVTSDHNLYLILLLATGVTISLATLPQAHAVGATVLALRTYRARCSSRHSPLDLWHHGKTQVMEG